MILEISALKPDLKLSEDREREINPESGFIYVRQLVRLADAQIVAVLSSGFIEDTCVYLVQDEGAFQPISGLPSVEWVWSAGTELLVHSGDDLLVVDLDGKHSKVTDLPDKAGRVDAVWCQDGLRAVAVSTGERFEDPLILPADRDQDRLWSYAPTQGWMDMGPIVADCWSLRLSRDGSKCVWREAVSAIPEEALRGEIVACDLSSGETTRVTDGAGQARTAEILSDGSGVVYHANLEQERPITTNLSLWYQAFEETEPKRLTIAGRTVVDFGWLDEKDLWVSFVDGVDRVTEIVSLNGESERLDLPSVSDVIRDVDGGLSYVTEDRAHFPYIRVFGKAVEIDQPESLDDLEIRVVDWTASDGMSITGVVHEHRGLADGAPLIVRAHGGPAGEVEATRSSAIRHRHLIRGGYRIFEPAFRGSLGFGDDFLGANIGCQGEADLDDIVTGVDHLVDAGVADRDRVGIFGGSYGGYMTLRAAAVTDRFKTGVALYGFIDNRWMTLETGDFTYENEYIAPVTWPLGDDAVKADVFSRLHDIECPILLLHGDQDPICALSQSKIVYRALEDRGVSTGLVVYPGEGHGFGKPEHRQDCARRTLAWFEQFLPT